MGDAQRREALPSAFVFASDDEDNGSSGDGGDGAVATDASPPLVTEGTLAAHEAELARMKRHWQKTCRLVKQVRYRNDIITQRREFARSANDPARFRIPGRLLAEEKLRRVVAKTLPRLEAALRSEIVAWEAINGAFVINDRRYLDEMRGDDSNDDDGDGDVDAENRTEAVAVAADTTHAAALMGPPAVLHSRKKPSSVACIKSRKKTSKKTVASAVTPTRSSMKSTAKTTFKTPRSSAAKASSRKVVKTSFPTKRSASKLSSKSSATTRRVFAKLQNHQ